MRNAIVTGAGRNKGIGAEICRVFAKNGINIYFTSFDFYDDTIGNISRRDYTKTLEECSSYGVNVYFDLFDLTSQANIKKLFSG